MSSRVLVQLLLSLLLLVSQQLALGHGYTHLQRVAGEQARAGAGEKHDGSQPGSGADQLCAWCASAHELVSGLGGVPAYAFKAVAPVYVPPLSTFTPPACLQVIRVFQPRAPPRI